MIIIFPAHDRISKVAFFPDYIIPTELYLQSGDGC